MRAKGWLSGQLRRQADGLTGHADELMPDIGPNSGWLGGTGESWERGPYYVKGLVALAYVTQDPALIAKAKTWMNWTLENQRRMDRSARNPMTIGGRAWSSPGPDITRRPEIRA